MKQIYMDHAATTPVDPKVVEAMAPYLSEKYGNPSSLYSAAQEAKMALEDARAKVAALINAKPEEIVFTSGGTESNNLALKGAAFAKKKGHIITSAIEHHAILHPLEWLEKRGFGITYLPVDKDGILSVDSVENAIRKDTILISVMHANNEIGTMQPIGEIGSIASEHGIYFHTDAVQTVGKIPVDAGRMHIDMLSISSHKLYGPKGVGALYLKKGTKIEPLFHGGGHERRVRSGTENVSGIVGFAKACEISMDEMGKEGERLTRLRDRLIKGVLRIENSWLNGHPKKRLPGNANFGFKFIEGESLILELDFNGIIANTGSACSSASLKPSHVLTAIGLRPEYTHGSLRLTMGRQNTEEDVDYVIETLPKVVGRLREMSPFKRDFGEYEQALGKEHE
ncbi:MAG: cysteine desulfurase NifS [Candidatus Hydrothermarchaeaceae archaeon]